MVAKKAAVIVLLLAAVVSMIRPATAVSNNIALDGVAGTGSQTFSYCDIATGGTALSTTKYPDILITTLIINDTTSTISKLTNDAGFYSTSAINWHLRQTFSATLQIWEYYTVVTTPVTNLKTNFTMTNQNHNTGGAICMLAAFSGIDPINPFDSNPAIPETNSGASSHPTASFITTQQTDLLLLLEGDCAANGIGVVGFTKPAGWSQVSNPGGLGGANGCSGANAATDSAMDSLQTISAVQSSVTYSDGLTPASSNWVTISDVLTSPRAGAIGGCGLFLGGICNPAPASFAFQSSTICPLGNATFSIGCYAVPSQLTGGQVGLLVTLFSSGVLLSTLLRPRLPNLNLGFRRRKRDRRTSLV
jgi:hypothetical protein